MLYSSLEVSLTLTRSATSVIFQGLIEGLKSIAIITWTAYGGRVLEADRLCDDSFSN